MSDNTILLTDKLCKVTVSGELYFNQPIEDECTIIIPEKINERIIQYISSNCFMNSKATNIILPNTIVSIGNNAFVNCNNLTKINIPDSVRCIGNFAFYDCKSLCNITGMKNVITFRTESFGNTPWLKNKQKESPYVDINNILIDGSAASGNIAIPENVKIISPSSFIENKNIMSLTIHDNVTKISKFAFSKCSNLKFVCMDDSVEEMGMAAFGDCTNLKFVKLSNSLTTIDRSMFAGCTNLQNINIPSKIEHLVSFSFLGCKNLKLITIPMSLTNIDTNVFSDCTNLDIAYQGSDEQLQNIFNCSLKDEFAKYNINLFSTNGIDNFINNINDDNNYEDTFKKLDLSLSGQQKYLVNRINEKINDIPDLNKKLNLLSYCDSVNKDLLVSEHNNSVERQNTKDHSI